MEDKKKDSGQSRLESFFGGKGFYIVLFLCVGVIGVSAWTLLSSGRSTVQKNTVVTVTAKPVATPAPTAAETETIWDVPEDAVEVVAEPTQPRSRHKNPSLRRSLSLSASLSRRTWLRARISGRCMGR